MKPRNATDERDTIPAICSASMISLDVSATTIAVGAMGFFSCLMNLTINTTILGNVDLSVVQCCCFLDLVFDEC